MCGATTRSQGEMSGVRITDLLKHNISNFKKKFRGLPNIPILTSYIFTNLFQRFKKNHER